MNYFWKFYFQLAAAFPVDNEDMPLARAFPGVEVEAGINVR